MSPVPSNLDWPRYYYYIIRLGDERGTKDAINSKSLNGGRRGR